MAKRTSSDAAGTRQRESGTRLGVPINEYKARREKVLRALRGGSAAASPARTGIVYAGSHAAPDLGRWRPDLDFQYLTGIDDEPGAAVLFDPSSPDPRRRIVLFLRPIDPELDRWDGLRPEISAALKESTGFEAVMRTTSLPNLLTRAAVRTKRLACLHKFRPYTAPATPDLDVFQQICSKIPGCAIDDESMLLTRMRAIKTPAEIAVMKRAAAATAAGYEAALKAIRPGANERDVQRALERAFEDNGALCPGGSGGAGGGAYNPIVGAGKNACVLHYSANNAALEDGQVVLIDFGASVDGYACDVTRSYPVGGAFSKRQREIYSIVLGAQKAAIRAARPGARMSDVDAAARTVIDKAGYGDFYIHGIGHDLGLHVHDPDPEEPLKPGRVVTIEPGIYLPDDREGAIGVRIEDDVVITESGNVNLTAAIPKEIEDVEAAMKKNRN